MKMSGRGSSRRARIKYFVWLFSDEILVCFWIVLVSAVVLGLAWFAGSISEFVVEGLRSIYHALLVELRDVYRFITG